MAKKLILEEGSDAIIIYTEELTNMKTIPYAAITGLSMHKSPKKVDDPKDDLSDFIIIKADNRETRIDFDKVLTPDEADVEALFAEIWSWVYTDTMPTP